MTLLTKGVSDPPTIVIPRAFCVLAISMCVIWPSIIGGFDIPENKNQIIIKYCNFHPLFNLNIDKFKIKTCFIESSYTKILKLISKISYLALNLYIMG